MQKIKNRLSGYVEEIQESEVISEEGLSHNKDNVSIDSIDTLDETVELNVQGVIIKGYPALVRDGKQVNIRVLDSKALAKDEIHKALRQFVIRALPEQIKNLRKTLPDIQRLCLKYADFGSCEDLKHDIINKTIDDIFLYDDIKTGSQFKDRIEENRNELNEKAQAWCLLVSGILDDYRAIKKLIKSPALSQLDTVADIQQQINYLFPKNFITIIDQQWLQQYSRYLTAIKKRFEKARTNAGRDRQLRIEFAKLWDEYIRREELLSKQHIESEQLNHYRWMLEEYRVSLFAQELKTRFPISEKRLKNYWNELSDA